MPLFEQIKGLLDSSRINYELLEHPPVYTSEQAARVRQDVSLSQGAKAMVIKVKSKKLEVRSTVEEGKDAFVMVVVPGDRRIDYKKVRKFLMAKDVTLASPEEVKEVSGVEVGAVPPLGNLFGLKILVDVNLLNNEKLAFNAGSHRHSILMTAADWQCLVNPLVGDFVPL